MIPKTILESPRIVSAQLDREGRIVWVLFSYQGFLLEIEEVNGQWITRVS
jgi:hypothetical protein